MIELGAAPYYAPARVAGSFAGAKMRDLSEKNFGILIACVLPGFVALSGLSFVSPTVARWLAMPPHEPSLSGVCFVILGSLGAGLTLGAVRWALLDPFHRLIGVKQPSWSFAELHEKLPAFYAVVLAHYRYYRFYGSMAIAVPVWIACRLIGHPLEPVSLLWLLASAGLEVVLILASRDSLSKYHARASELLAPVESSRLILASDLNRERQLRP